MLLTRKFKPIFSNFKNAKSLCFVKSSFSTHAQVANAALMSSKQQSQHLRQAIEEGAIILYSNTKLKYYVIAVTLVTSTQVGIWSLWYLNHKTSLFDKAFTYFTDIPLRSNEEVGESVKEVFENYPFLNIVAKETWYAVGGFLSVCVFWMGRRYYKYSVSELAILRGYRNVRIKSCGPLGGEKTQIYPIDKLNGKIDPLGNYYYTRSIFDKSNHPFWMVDRKKGSILNQDVLEKVIMGDSIPIKNIMAPAVNTAIGQQQQKTLKNNKNRR